MSEEILKRAIAHAQTAGTKTGWLRFLRAVRKGDSAGSKYFRKNRVRAHCASMSDEEFAHYWHTAKFFKFVDYTSNGHFVEGSLLEEALKVR